MAQVYARRGAHVSILARRQELLDQTLAELEDLRVDGAQRFEARSVDVSDFRQVETAIDSLAADGYGVDLLVNAAGIVHCGYFEDIPMSAFHQVFDIDLFGTVHAVKAVLPTMMERKKGHIVNFSSIAGFLGTFGYTAYASAKFAVRGFTDALRDEVKPYGIYVSCVFPQDTDTPQVQQERQMQPLEARRVSESGMRLLDVHRVAESIVRGIERRQPNVLPGLKVRFFFPILDGPQFLTRLFRRYFIDRVIAQVLRERGLEAGRAGVPGLND